MRFFEKFTYIPVYLHEINESFRHMRIAFLIVTLIVSSLLGCAPTTKIEGATSQCKIVLGGKVTEAQMHNRQITFLHETGEILYFDLTTNTFVCAPKIQRTTASRVREGNKGPELSMRQRLNFIRTSET